VRTGVVVRSTDDRFAETVHALEAAGVHTLWFGIDDPEGDPIVLAAAAAVATSQVGLTVVLDEPTAVTAKAVASLDALSEGRVRVVVGSAEGLALVRAMLSNDSGVPIRPAPVQEQIPVWTTDPDLTNEADGLVLLQGTELGDDGPVAVILSDLESFEPTGVLEVVLSAGDALWETVGKVLHI
jgi:hypothetical protein